MPTPISRATGAARAKILVVDDDPIVLEVVKERLTEAGYEVHVREEALGTSQWIASCAPDFVLLDVCMPALSGNELAQLLRRRSVTSNAAVILHSSLPRTELEAMLAATGAIGVVSKELDESRFLSEVQRIIARHRAARAPQP
jgi:CheY-like chemotaxis protein